MAFAVSPTQTVLSGSGGFSGSPVNLPWVLPVKPGAYIELSSDAWFESLERGHLHARGCAANPVQAAELRRRGLPGGGNSGCGCGEMSAVALEGGSSSSAGSSGDPGESLLRR